MADYSHILFNKSPMQLRLLGARGGRAFGRNQRARRALSPPSPEVLPLAPVVRETTPEAIAVLDSQFPWLRAPRVHDVFMGVKLGTHGLAENQDESKVPDCMLSQVVAGR